MKKCELKVSYDSFDDALGAASVFETYETGTQSWPYKCPLCGKFHLTRDRRAYQRYNAKVRRLAKENNNLKSNAQPTNE